MKHENKVIKKILDDEFADYYKNSWHYDREYKLIEKGLNYKPVHIINPRKIVIRLLASPFILAILIISYACGCIRKFMNFTMYGGEYLYYTKDDPKRMQDIYELLTK